jgi:hypothetical protein
MARSHRIAQHKPMRTKKEIRALVADGRLPEAAEAALQYAEATGDANTLNGLIALNSDLTQHREGWLSGQTSFEEFSRGQARVTHHLLDRVDELPDEPNPTAIKKRMREENYKWQVFYLFIASKLLVFLWTFFMWRTEGFQTEEALTAFNALLPGFMVYAAIMFKALFRSGIAGDGPKRFVPTRFRTIAWVVFIGYTVVQVFLVTEKVKGNITFTTMNLALVAVEAGMGRFIGEMVEGLFKEKQG